MRRQRLTRRGRAPRRPGRDLVAAPARVRLVERGDRQDRQRWTDSGPGRSTVRSCCRSCPAARHSTSQGRRRRSGCRSGHVVVLGGHAGDWMEAALRARAIDTRAVRLAGETRTCLSVLDEATGLLTEFYEPGLTLDADGWASVDEALARGARRRSVRIAGRARREPAARRADRRVRAPGRRSRREPVPGPSSTPTAAALDEALAARPWLVKVNAREATAAVWDDRHRRGRRPRGGASTARPDGRRRAGDAGTRTAPWSSTTPAVPGGSARHPSAVATRWGAAIRCWPGCSWRSGPGIPLPEAARRGGAVAAANALVPGQGEFDPADADRMLPAITLDRIA